MTARRPLRGRRRLGVAVLVALVAVGCARSDAVELTAPTTTTAPAPTAPPTTEVTTTTPEPDEVADPPGTIVTAEVLEADGLPGELQRITYVSRSIHDDEIVVSGLVARPDGQAPPGGFPVLSWAHGTTGIGDDCAPSLLGAAALPLLADHLEAGYAVAATDYEGLGTPGVHPYLVAGSEGRGVLDAARAARQVFGPDVVGSRLALLGHSQGGHAALAAAELAPSWAPELELVGTAAIAPAADLERVIPALFDSTIGLALGIYVAVGWSAVHPELSPSDLLADEGLALLDEASERCVNDVGSLVVGEDLGELRVERPSEVEAWAERIQEHTIHAVDVPGPVLIAQGGGDTVVPKVLVDQLITDLCDAGVPLRYLFKGSDDHGTIVRASMSNIHDWFERLLGDAGAPNDCAGR